jgi:ubiquinone/menaquinone biosynthesis C-methylase UbiE
MFATYNYFRQYNDDKSIDDFKEFYKKFSNDREFGANFTNYDHLVKNRFSDSFQAVYNAVLRRMPEKILDVGCGNGVNLPLSKILPVEYHGLDYAEKSVETARKNYPNVTFHIGDAFNMEFENDTFDMLILSNVLVLYKNETDQLKLLNECKRVLKSDGVLILVMLNAAPVFHISVLLSRLLGKLCGEKLPQDFNCLHFSRSEIRRLSGKAGLEVKESVLASSAYGVLESVRYLNFAKYRRKFGVAESEAHQHPQNVLADLKRQAGRYSALTHLYYLLSKISPSLFSYFSVNMIEKSK